MEQRPERHPEEEERRDPTTSREERSRTPQTKEEKLDEAIEESFPASDPPAVGGNRKPS